MGWLKRDDSNPTDDAALPQRTDKAARHAAQVLAAATESEPGPARPGRENGSWSTGDRDRDH